jgi:hypothetical protein
MKRSARSVVIAAVVAFYEPVVASGRNIFLVQAAIPCAKCCGLFAMKVLEVQFDHMGILGICHKIMNSMRRMFAQTDNDVPNLGRQTIDML